MRSDHDNIYVRTPDHNPVLTRLTMINTNNPRQTLNSFVNDHDYWLMFIDGDITEETLVELINNYV